MKKFKYAAAFCAAAVLGSVLTAQATDFTTVDSVLTLQIPDDGWTQVADKDTWVTLAEGNDRITLQHYSNGEKLPAITVADSSYAKVCQMILSTKNEVFIITGSAAEEADFEKVEEAVESAVINKYDTKTAVQTVSGDTAGAEETTDTAEEYQVKDVTEYTTYVMSSTLNIRSSCSTGAPVLAAANYADALTVTGTVMLNGADAGWYRVNYKGITGYVASEYTDQGGPTAEAAGLTLTDEQLTLYGLDGSGVLYIQKAADGCWYDGYGRQYTSDGTDLWICQEDGSEWSSYESDSNYIIDNAEDQMQIADQEGSNQMTIYQFSENGEWYNSAGGLFVSDGNGHWTGQDGSIWNTLE